MPSECRLCDWTGPGLEALLSHLDMSHRQPDEAEAEAVLTLTAAKDGPEWYENTFAVYLPAGRLVGILVESQGRAPDDPMRLA